MNEKMGKKRKIMEGMTLEGRGRWKIENEGFNNQNKGCTGLSS